MPTRLARGGGWGAVTLVAALLLAAFIFVIGCQGPAGPPGSSAGTTGTVSGKVTNNLNGSAVAGVTVTTDPAIQGVTITTGNDGAYTASLPIGVYTLSFKKDNFDAATATASVVAGQTATRNIVLKALKPVAVNAGAAQQGAPGGTVTLKATATPIDGSTISGYKWEQVDGAKATLDGSNTDTVKVTLANAAAYKAQLVKSIEMQDRLVVQGISPHAMAAAETATFKVTVTTSSGSYSGTTTVTTDLPYDVSTGLQNVPMGVPVMVHGKNQGSYSWTVTGPSGTKAALDSATDQNPVFTPDVVGKYTLSEKTIGSIDVYAGTWAGAITGQDAKGQPLAAGCTVCHNGTIASDNFKDWKQSGHAAIFTKNINDPNGHWSLACASCHTVGYNTKATNGGADEAMKAENWTPPPHGEPGYWTMMLSKFPKTAKLANIQCENCHGPNEGSGLHNDKQLDPARISVSADVCGSCHGEPPRHGRFQQWEESGHANFELAIDEATVENRGATAGHCGRCHSAQGFLSWIAQGDLTKQIQGAKGNATVDELRAMGLTKDKVQPQTCTVCHDPHNEGYSSGEPNTATVRITGNTSLLPAGFQALNVGKGALCMTCHNTRNGTHNNDAPPTNYSAPHVAAQADVLMGENAYLVQVDARSPHASIKDACVTCHLEITPPPADLSYQLSGTNHSFKANTAICSSCHSNLLDGKAFQTSYASQLEDLGAKMATYLSGKLPAQVSVIDYTPHTSGGKAYDIKSDRLNIDKANIASLEPFEPHGQQGFLFKLKSPVNVTYKPATESAHTVSVTEIEVQLGDISGDGGKTPIIAVSDVLVKVGWNYFLVHGDASQGIHNPEFIRNVLDASLEALFPVKVPQTSGP